MLEYHSISLIFFPDNKYLSYFTNLLRNYQYTCMSLIILYKNLQCCYSIDIDQGFAILYSYIMRIVYQHGEITSIFHNIKLIGISCIRRPLCD